MNRGTTTLTVETCGDLMVARKAATEANLRDEVSSTVAQLQLQGLPDVGFLKGQQPCVEVHQRIPGVISYGHPPFPSVTVQSRRLTLFLIEDQTLTFDIPLQREEVQQRVNLFKDIWSSDKLAIETDGTLICIPWSSIRYVQLEPIEEGDVLPSPVLKGLKLID